MIENLLQAVVLAVAVTLIIATAWWLLKILWHAYRWISFPRHHGHMTLSNSESINWYAVSVRKEETKRFKGPKLLDLI